MRVRPSNDEIGALYKERHQSAFYLSLLLSSCHVGTQWESMSVYKPEGEFSPETSHAENLILDFRLLTFRTVKKYISVVLATQSVVFCDSSMDWPRQCLMCSNSRCNHNTWLSRSTQGNTLVGLQKMFSKLLDELLMLQIVTFCFVQNFLFYFYF